MRITKKYLQQVYAEHPEVQVTETVPRDCWDLEGLLGWCIPNPLRIYIYKYMSNKQKLAIFYHEYGHALQMMENKFDEKNIVENEYGAVIYAGKKLIEINAYPSLEQWVEGLYNWFNGNDEENKHLDKVVDRVMNSELWSEVSRVLNKPDMMDAPLIDKPMTEEELDHMYEMDEY